MLDSGSKNKKDKIPEKVKNHPVVRWIIEKMKKGSIQNTNSENNKSLPNKQPEKEKVRTR